MAHDATRASAVSYFYGRISRDEAENILKKAGAQEGLYLLRENVSNAGNYALSICHHGRLVISSLLFAVDIFNYAASQRRQLNFDPYLYTIDKIVSQGNAEHICYEIFCLTLIMFLHYLV